MKVSATVEISDGLKLYEAKIEDGSWMSERQPRVVTLLIIAKNSTEARAKLDEYCPQEYPEIDLKNSSVNINLKPVLK